MTMEFRDALHFANRHENAYDYKCGLIGAPQDANITRISGGKTRVQHYNMQSGKLLTTSHYPHSDNSELHTNADGDVVMIHRKDGVKTTTQTKVNGLADFVKFMRPRMEALYE